MNTQIVLGNRYRLDAPLGQGGMGAVYRAYDRLTGQYVALKQVAVQPEQLMFNSRADSTDVKVALAREFQILASLRHPNIISVLDYGFDAQRQPYFTMLLLENSRRITEEAEQADPKRKINLAIQVLQALSYLHRHHIIHRDLKPANILVDSEGVARVLDFGLAVQQRVRGTAGTLAYMAPEVFMEGTISEAADLYAVGVMLFEWQTGRHPFDTGDPNRFVHNILTGTPNLNGCPEALHGVMLRLLARSPEDRYTDAVQVIHDLCFVTNTEVPIESASVRESYLQTAKFVGRQNELRKLSAFYQQAVAGKGSVCLVYGERGIGKSRLLDEFVIQIQVQGALVLRGSASEKSGQPFQIWRDVLPGLLLVASPEPHEARFLKALIPDLERLIDQVVPDAIMPTGVQIADIIISLVKRANIPVLMILEDLHWANESLLPLRAMFNPITTLPMLLIGTYSTDNDPYLYGKLPPTQMIALQRLSEAELAELSRMILGRSTPPILRLLQEQTEGNVYFAVEVLRALAETVGSLDDIGKMPLPKQVDAKGIYAIVRRRVQRLALDYQPVLRLAAVLGREIDFKLLESVDDEMDYLDWLTACSNASLLAPSEDGERWLFTHEKVRDGVLNGLDDHQIRHLHTLAGQAIETVYGEDNPEVDLRLVNHWYAAEMPDKAAKYALRAARRMLGDRMAEDTLLLITQVLDLPLELGVLAELMQLAGQACLILQDDDQASKYFDASAAIRQAIRPV